MSPIVTLEHSFYILKNIYAKEIFSDLVEQLVNEYCMKRGVSLSSTDNQKSNPNEEPMKALRSRGLCLVPISCTLQVGSDNGADYWAPALGFTLQWTIHFPLFYFGSAKKISRCYNIMSNQSIEKTTKWVSKFDCSWCCTNTYWFWRLAFEHFLLTSMRWYVESCFLALIGNFINSLKCICDMMLLF